jgi:insulysin
MKAIDSENARYMNMDSWRFWHLMRKTCKEGHPFNKFGCGDLKSLGGTPGARDDLLKFHDEFYSSNIMNLVILSNHSLDTMEEWAKKYFNEVKNQNTPKLVPDSNPFG